MSPSRTLKADLIGINYFKPEIVTQIDTAVAKHKSKFNYINVALSYKGYVVYTKSYGNNSVNSQYVYASVSKPVTSTIIMQLFESGMIKSLDDSLGDYITTIDGQSCTQKTWTATPVTIRHLLTHQSGIPHNDKPTCTNGQLNLQFEPGTAYLYSTPGYGILGEIAEKLTGKNYATLVQEMIAQPVKATSFKADDRFDAPGGFVYSSVADLAAFSTGIYSKTYMTDNLLYNQVLYPYHDEPGLGSFGLGWLCSNFDTSDLTAFHPGSNASDVATIRIKPRKELSVSMLANANFLAGQNPLEPLASELITIMENSPNPIDPSKPLPSPSLSVTPKVTLTPVIPGDANGDLVVNGMDYLVWLTNYGRNITGSVLGDFNNDAEVDGVDYIIWLTNYPI